MSEDRKQIALSPNLPSSVLVSLLLLTLITPKQEIVKSFSDV